MEGWRSCCLEAEHDHPSKFKAKVEKQPSGGYKETAVQRSKHLQLDTIVLQLQLVDLRGVKHLEQKFELILMLTYFCLAIHFTSLTVYSLLCGKVLLQQDFGRKISYDLSTIDNQLNYCGTALALPKWCITDTCSSYAIPCDHVAWRG